MSRWVGLGPDLVRIDPRGVKEAFKTPRGAKNGNKKSKNIKNQTNPKMLISVYVLPGVA